MGRKRKRWNNEKEVEEGYEVKELEEEEEPAERQGQQLPPLHRQYWRERPDGVVLRGHLITWLYGWKKRLHGGGL